ncbi:MAG: M15 family metallopeptidase [Candidatus Saccharimonadales bacterium]
MPRRINKNLAIFIIILVIALLTSLGLGYEKLSDSKIDRPISSPKESGKKINQFNKSQHSLNEATSLWVIVNKGRQLPKDYRPGNLGVPAVSLRDSRSSDNMLLRSDAASKLENLFADASSAGIKLMLVSGYRSYATQQVVYTNYVKAYGQAYSDATSARAGHSEHQTGLAADVGAVSRRCELLKCFADLEEGAWITQNAHRFGYFVRYEKDKQSLTGYDFEPWHLRYVGKELATQIKDSGQTLEQFFGLPAFSDYPSSIYRLLPVR